jgi:hypothetical protein
MQNGRGKSVKAMSAKASGGMRYRRRGKMSGQGGTPQSSGGRFRRAQTSKRRGGRSSMAKAMMAYAGNMGGGGGGRRRDPEYAQKMRANRRARLTGGRSS